MSDQFTSQIMMFGGNFAPRAWALCDGQLLAISSNDALFSLLGTTYGGDGRTTFGLPGLRGRVAMHAGNGPGLTPRRLGQKSGTEINVMTANTMPTHNHTATGKLKVNDAAGNSKTAPGNFLATDSDPNDSSYHDAAGDSQEMIAGSINVTVNSTGGSQAINNMSPFLGVNYIICLFGIYPSRN